MHVTGVALLHQHASEMGTSDQRRILRMAHGTGVGVAHTEPLSLTTFEFRLAETAGFVTFAYPESFLHETFSVAEEPQKAPLEPAQAGPA